MSTSTEKPKTSTDILAKGMEDFSKLKASTEKSVETLVKLKQKLVNGFAPTDAYLVPVVTSTNLKTRLAEVLRRNKRITEIFLINYAKVNLDDAGVLEVIGEFKIWKIKAEEIATLQKLLMENIVIGKEQIKLLGECIELLTQLETKAVSDKSTQSVSTIEISTNPNN